MIGKNNFRVAVIFFWTLIWSCVCPVQSGFGLDKPVIDDLPNLISMATELEKRSELLDKEMKALIDLAQVKKQLAGLSKETQKNHRHLKSLAKTSNTNFDTIFNLKSRTDKAAFELNGLIQSVNQGIEKVQLREKEWMEEGERWEKLESTMSKQLAFDTLKPTFTKVAQIITRSLQRISNHLDPMLAQLQAAEVIRASQSSLAFELEDIRKVLNEALMRKNSRSMFSAQYYTQLMDEICELKNSIPKQIHGLSVSDLQFDPLVGLAIVLMVLVRFNNSFDDSFFQKEKGLVCGICIQLVAVRFFSLYTLPSPLFRCYIFITALIGGFICLSRSSFRHKKSIKHNGVIDLKNDSKVSIPPHSNPDSEIELNTGRLNKCFFRFGLLLFGILLIGEMGGYSNLSKHLMRSSFETIFILLSGWISQKLMISMLGRILSPPGFKRIPFLHSKAPIIISRSSILIRILTILISGAFILVAWRVFSSPNEAIEAILSAGVTLGARHVTIGLLLIATGSLYLSFVISWAVQAMLMEGLLIRCELQIGVRISIARLVHYGFVFFGSIAALLTLGVDLRDLTIIAGALGVGIGFGLQGIVNNFVSGLILLFERPVKVGDFIELEDEQAEIKKIGLRATVVQTPERSEIVVPNSDLISNKITNWTLSDQYAGIKIPVRVACESDVSYVKRALLACAHNHPKVAQHPAPQALFMGFGESALEFELRGWISDIADIYPIKSELREKIGATFTSMGIEVPFPRQDLHLHMEDHDRTERPEYSLDT